MIFCILEKNYYVSEGNNSLRSNASITQMKVAGIKKSLHTPLTSTAVEEGGESLPVSQLSDGTFSGR